MSLQELSNVVPCVICKKEMVPLGKLGDTGKKKCLKCRNKEQNEKNYIKLKIWRSKQIKHCSLCSGQFIGSEMFCSDYCKWVKQTRRLYEWYQRMKLVV